MTTSSSTFYTGYHHYYKNHGLGFWCKPRNSLGSNSITEILQKKWGGIEIYSSKTVSTNVLTVYLYSGGGWYN